MKNILIPKPIRPAERGHAPAIPVTAHPGRTRPLPALLTSLMAAAAGLAPLSETAAREEKERTVEAEFSTIQWSSGDYARDDKPVEFFYRTSGEYRPLRPQIRQMGETTHYRGPETMVLYEREKNENAEGEEKWIYRPAESVKLANAPHFLLFLLVRNSGSNIRAAAIDISEPAIPPGAIAFLNLTDKRVAADIRDDRQSVPTVQSALFRPAESDSPDLPLKIAVFDEQWEEVYATVTRVRADRPYLMVFHTVGHRGDAYRLRIFRNLYQIRKTDAAASSSRVASD